MKNICFVVSSEMTVRAFLIDQITALSQRYNVSVVVNTMKPQFLNELKIDADVIPIAIERKLSPLQDIKALFYLICLFNKRKFDIVHSVTPKAGFLAMISGFLARIPIRIHTFTGQVWATRSGIKRLFLKGIDRLIAFFATNILVDSNSQRDFLIAERVISNEKSHVLARGSISGVDISRFRPNPNARIEIRSSLNIADNEYALLFLGRLNKDKGVLDLAKAFMKVHLLYPGSHLLFVGPDEEDMKSKILELCQSYVNKIHFVEFTAEPERYMAAADIFCLPSYREGFGSVIIEAAAVGVPSIGSRIYGIVDAIEEGVTGLLFETGNSDDLALKILQLIENKDLNQRLGSNARNRAISDFSQQKVTAAVVNYYDSLDKIAQQ